MNNISKLKQKHIHNNVQYKDITYNTKKRNKLQTYIVTYLPTTFYITRFKHYVSL